MQLKWKERATGKYEYFYCVEGISDKCFGVVDIEKSKGKEIDYGSVESWPNKGCEYQVGRLTCTTDRDRVVYGKLEELLGVNIESESDEKKIADDGAKFICHLGRLSNVRIREEYRGKKIAKNLIDLMKKRLENHIIFLHVESDTPGVAFRLYEKSGFKSFKKDKDYMVYIPENRKESYTKLSEKLIT